MSLCFKWSFFLFFSFSTKSPSGNSGSFSGRSSLGLMETREVESFGRPAGIKIPLTSCSGATCCHSSSSFSSLFLLSTTTAAAAAAAFFIYLHPSHSLLPSDHHFISSHRRKPPPPPTLLHLLPFPLCDFFFSFSAYVATSVFTLRARRNLPPNRFHHEYFMISGPISHRRHVVLYSAAAAAACQRPSPFPQL